MRLRHRTPVLAPAWFPQGCASTADRSNQHRPRCLAGAPRTVRLTCDRPALRPRAGAALAFRLDGCLADLEPEPPVGVLQGVCEFVVFQFGHLAAGAADQELGGVGVIL